MKIKQPLKPPKPIFDYSYYKPTLPISMIIKPPQSPYRKITKTRKPYGFDITRYRGEKISKLKVGFLSASGSYAKYGKATTPKTTKALLSRMGLTVPSAEQLRARKKEEEKKRQIGKLFKIPKMFGKSRKTQKKK